MNYIHTDDAAMSGMVVHTNELLNKWEGILRRERDLNEHRGETLTLYIDPETEYQFNVIGNCGPLQVCHTMAPGRARTTLFGYDVFIVIVVRSDDRYYDHLTWR